MTTQDSDNGISNASIRTAEEASALSALVSALTPLERSAQLRLLRTISTFFELPFVEIKQGSGPAVQSGPGLGNVPDSTASPSFSEDRSMSPKAFLLEKRPQSDVERVTCLAYYLTHYRDQPTFKTLDLSQLNTEAAQIKLSNPTRAVDNASAAHFLIQSGQGRKQLSAIGEIYVQALPDKAAARQAVADLKKRRGRTKLKSNGNDAEPISGGGSESPDSVSGNGPD